MVYHAGNLVLEPIGAVFHGTVNDVLICRDLNSPVGMRYLLLLIWDRSCIKQLLAVFESSQRSSDSAPYFLRFTQNELLGFVFPYRDERRLASFSAGQTTTPLIRERICINLVIECMSSPLPYPLLHLILAQDCIHLEKDNSVYFLPTLDLARLDPEKTEADCTALCAQRLLVLLEEGRRRKHLKSYELIHKKCAKRAYSGFPELYRDIKVTAMPAQRQSLKGRLKEFWARSRDTVFHILLTFSIIVVILALIFFFSQLFFGDIPLLRLFERAFEVIGTESLVE